LYASPPLAHEPVRKVPQSRCSSGGSGLRPLPATETQPKELLPIVNKLTTQYTAEETAASGIENYNFNQQPPKLNLKAQSKPIGTRIKCRNIAA
jgi:hypothetical protein